MTKIYKYVLETTDSQYVNMPAEAEVLCVQTQHGTPCIWARVDPDAPTHPRRFLVFGTGHEITGYPGRYVGTYQIDGGALIFHVYEECQDDES